MDMLSFADALERVLTHVRPPTAERVPFDEAPGRVLAEPLVAQHDDPPAPKSAMDGFAVAAADTAGATPDAPLSFAWREVIAAGHAPTHPVGPGQAARIMTGALLPEGADAVVKQEDTLDRGDGAFALARPLRPGENVFPRGQRIAAGEELVPGGAVVTPQTLGVLASLNRPWVPVYRPPRVAVLALGDELVEVGRPLRSGQIHVSNLYVLAALARRYGAEVARLGVAPDDTAAIVPLLEARVRQADADPERACDVVVTVGGSMQGDFDVIDAVLHALGAHLHFRRTAVNLGRSTLFATAGETLLFGLPGAPMPAWGAFELLVRPALWKAAGRRDLSHPRVQAQLAASARLMPGRANFLPAWLEPDGHGPPRVYPLGRRRQADLPPDELANALICTDGERERLEPGSLVEVMWLGGSRAD